MVLAGKVGGRWSEERPRVSQPVGEQGQARAPAFAREGSPGVAAQTGVSWFAALERRSGPGSDSDLPHNIEVITSICPSQSEVGSVLSASSSLILDFACDFIHCLTV